VELNIKLSLKAILCNQQEYNVGMFGEFKMFFSGLKMTFVGLRIFVQYVKNIFFYGFITINICFDYIECCWMLIDLAWLFWDWGKLSV